MFSQCDHLVLDGHSLLLNTSSGRDKYARQGTKQRDRLVQILVHVQDYSGLKVHVMFDGKGTAPSKPDQDAGIAVFYAGEHQTADALIERAVARASKPSKIAVVTDDEAERSTLEAAGAITVSVDIFWSWTREIVPDWVWEKWEDSP